MCLIHHHKACMKEKQGRHSCSQYVRTNTPVYNHFSAAAPWCVKSRRGAVPKAGGVLRSIGNQGGNCILMRQNYACSALLAVLQKHFTSIVPIAKEALQQMEKVRKDRWRENIKTFFEIHPVVPHVCEWRVFWEETNINAVESSSIISMFTSSFDRRFPIFVFNIRKALLSLIIYSILPEYVN